MSECTERTEGQKDGRERGRQKGRPPGPDGFNSVSSHIVKKKIRPAQTFSENREKGNAFQLRVILVSWSELESISFFSI